MNKYILAILYLNILPQIEENVPILFPPTPPLAEYLKNIYHCQAKKAITKAN